MQYCTCVSIIADIIGIEQLLNQKTNTFEARQGTRIPKLERITRTVTMSKNVEWTKRPAMKLNDDKCDLTPICLKSVPCPCTPKGMLHVIFVGITVMNLSLHGAKNIKNTVHQQYSDLFHTTPA